MLPKINAVMRLAKEPTTKFTPGGLQICELFLVASEKYKEKETSLFIGAVCFGKTAEFIASVQKGQRVFVSGKLQTESWEKDGQRQSKISMIIDSFDYIEKRDDNQPAQATNTVQAPQQTQQPVSNSSFDPDDDIPFIQHNRFLLS